MINIATPVTTARMILQPIAVDDHEFVLQLVNSDGWIQFIGDRNVHSEEAAKAYIHKIQQTPNLVYWVARLNDNQVPVGIISYMKRTYLDNYDLGFAFLPEYQQHGLAFEAARGILDFVINEIHEKTILATLLPENVKSIKLLIKLGFQFSATVDVENECLHIYQLNVT
jgi:[ribosomal protein S5]-alanine N-acetyltransferase